jgi:hypothetical protein
MAMGREDNRDVSSSSGGRTCFQNLNGFHPDRFGLGCFLAPPTRTAIKPSLSPRYDRLPPPLTTINNNPQLRANIKNLKEQCRPIPTTHRCSLLPCRLGFPAEALTIRNASSPSSSVPKRCSVAIAVAVATSMNSSWNVKRLVRTPRSANLLPSRPNRLSRARSEFIYPRASLRTRF